MNWLIDTGTIPSVVVFISHKVRVKVKVPAEANYTWNMSKTVTLWSRYCCHVSFPDSTHMRTS